MLIYRALFLILHFRKLIATSADANADTQMCHQENGNIKCQLHDDAIQINYNEELSDYFIRIRCSKESNNIKKLLKQVPPPTSLRFHNATRFELYDCLELPDMLRRPSMMYKGLVAFANQRIPHNFFWKSNGLHRLHLNIDYGIVTLPSQLFVNLTELKILAVTFQTAEKGLPFTAPTQLLHTLWNLESLHLKIFNSEGKFNALTSAHFQHLRLLRHFLFFENNIATLNDGVFATLSELTHLNLAMNKLKSLPQNLLATQCNLTFLDLSYNSLEYLPPGLFNRTHLLCVLNLSYNNFRNPSNIIENIRSLHNLHELDLYSNFIETISGTGSYANETLLSGFSHSDNNTDQLLIEDPLDIYVRLVFFTYSESRLRTEKINSKLFNLSSIDLRSNKITHFEMDWVTKSRLSCPFRIELSDNKIENVYALSQLSFGTSDACGQSEIILESNPLVCDCKLAWIFNNNYLYNLKFSTCNVASYSYEVSDIRRLQRSDFCDWQPALCPPKCVCATDAAILHINCTGARLETIPQLPRPAQFFGIANSTLAISHNSIKELPTHTTLGYGNVTQLNASYNHITEILTTQLPSNLTTLDLRNNRLESLSADFLMACFNESRTLKEMYLAQNPWKCDCSAKPFLLALRANSERIPDAEQLFCDNEDNERLLDVDVDAICANYNLYTILIYILIGAAFVLLFGIALFFKYQLEVQVWLYGHKMCLCFISEHELDKDKTFDAFISYAHQDAHFVNQTLRPQLECGVPAYRICTHERNWLGGAYIPEQIVESVAQSRRTIIVLSQHYIESNWARMEFHTAHHASLKERRSRIIIIKYGEIANTELLDRELKAYLDMNTYLMWYDQLEFWSKLRCAMPHKKGEVRDAGMLELRERVYVLGQVERNRWRDEQV